MNPFSFLDGYKTYMAAAGLFGLALYQFTQGQYDVGFQSLMAALAAFGVKSSLARQDIQVAEVKAKLVHRSSEEVK